VPARRTDASQELPNRRQVAPTDAANFSASGLKREDYDLIVIESAEAAAAFKRAFDARYAKNCLKSPRLTANFGDDVDGSIVVRSFEQDDENSGARVSGNR
jgi:hypothetical protein